MSLLTEGLVERGIDVTLFAAADSVTSARLVGTIPTGYSEDPDLDPKVWEGLHIATVFERAAEFDLIHNNFDFLPLTYSGPGRHARPDDDPRVLVGEDRAGLRAIRRSRPLRRDQRRRPASQAPLRGHDPSRHPDGDVPARARRRGTICCSSAASIRTRARRGDRGGTPSGSAVGDRRDRAGPGVLRTRRRSRMSTVIAFGTSAPSDPTSAAPCSAARATLLHLISFEEPFGFSVIESMACGTPVIATRRGSMPELVQDGVNGYLVDTPDQALEAIEAAGRLDRNAVRASVEQRFDVSRMVEAYIAGLPPDRRPGPGRVTPEAYAEPFRLGINYWPARTAMRWWTMFDEAETARTSHGSRRRVRFGSRIPDVGGVPARAGPSRSSDGRTSGDGRGPARDAGLDVMPTLFTGHMSGVDWIPAWALGGVERDARFRVVSGGRVVETGCGTGTSTTTSRGPRRCWRPARGGARGHAALWAWDLGNENSNCVVPADHELARRWLSRMMSAIRAADVDAGSRSGSTWRIWRRIAGSGRERPRTRATS